MQKKLLDIFLKATSDIKSKREIEWVLHDIYTTFYILFLIAGFYAVITWTGWALLLAMLIWLFLIYGWGWFEYRSRKALLGYLYPDGFEESEKQMDNLLDTLNNFMKQLE